MAEVCTTVGEFFTPERIETFPKSEQLMVQALLGVANGVGLEESWEAVARVNSFGQLFEAYSEGTLEEALGGLQVARTDKGIEVVHQSTGMKATGPSEWEAKKNLQETLTMLFTNLSRHDLSKNDVEAVWGKMEASIQDEVTARMLAQVIQR